MVELFFKATWIPDIKKFHVQFKCKGHTHVEMMEQDRYFAFCDSLDDRLEVAGWKIEFLPHGNNDPIFTDKIVVALRQYFRDIRRSYELSLQGSPTIFHL